MEILRVETFDQIGPYSGMFPSERPPACGERHPGPHMDGKLLQIWEDLTCISEWYFGFKDIKQLEMWWPKSDWHYFRQFNKKYESERKFGISTYDVDPLDLYIGETQVIFKMDRAQRLEFEWFDDNILGRIITFMTGK